jgi:hypothetical protein
MDAVHIHLFLNHFPIIGAIASVLLFAYAAVRKNDEALRIAFFAVVLTALLALPVYLTGEPAEEVAERLPGVSTAFIEDHEDAGKLAMILAMITGAAGLAWLLFAGGSEKVRKALTWLTILLSMVTAGAMARTGSLGGQIRHTEIRSTENVPATPSDQGTTRERENHEDH